MISALLALVLTAQPVELFRIEKSSNRNVVVYTLEDDRVRAEWILEKGGHEKLTGIEWNFAFGFDQRGWDVIPLAKKEWRVVIRDREAVLYGPGEPMILKRVFVKMMWPFNVVRVEFFGEDPSTREPVRQEYVPEPETTYPP